MNRALAYGQLDRTTLSDKAGGTEDYTATSFPSGSFPVVPLDQACVLFRFVCVLTSWRFLSVGLREAELSHCEHRISEICSQSELSPAPHETSSNAITCVQQDTKSRCSSGHKPEYHWIRHQKWTWIETVKYYPYYPLCRSEPVYNIFLWNTKEDIFSCLSGFVFIQ